MTDDLKMNLNIPYDVDNRDVNTTWIQTSEGYLEVYPWDLVDNVIENSFNPNGIVTRIAATLIHIAKWIITR